VIERKAPNNHKDRENTRCKIKEERRFFVFFLDMRRLLRQIRLTRPRMRLFFRKSAEAERSSRFVAGAR
jgi:hypothetical protein